SSMFSGQVFAADGYGDDTLDRVDTCVLARPTAWLFGNEARGLADQELALANHRVAVPLYGLAESLNVATAATICLYASAMAQSICYRQHHYTSLPPARCSADTRNTRDTTGGTAISFGQIIWCSGEEFSGK